MNDFQRILSDFFSKYLVSQRGVSDNTISNYKYTFILLFDFFKQTSNISSDKVKMEDLSLNKVNEYLNWLEKVKGVSISTRNNRLAGIKSLFRYI